MYQQSPETRLSLVGRLSNVQDHEAWTEFVAIYEPLILRLLTQDGLQESDARDVCQQVLSAVARDIEKWESDGRERSFRRWLFRIARNRLVDFVARERKRPRGSGGGDDELALQNAQENASISEWVEREYQQQLLLRAADQIRAEFHESTWDAFWRSCVHGQSIADVATTLGISAGSVYVARSRIIARLKIKVRQISDDED